jgi:LPXTG-site transpeptidase (sortase) family protein
MSRKSALSWAVFIASAFFITIAVVPKSAEETGVLAAPLHIPNTGRDTTEFLPPLTISPETVTVAPAIPVRVEIPAIGINSKILLMGKDKDGNMDVPSGKSNDVGWYKYGTLPGNIGSAVLDAHVFAAFKNLNKLEVGDEIFVFSSNGQKLRFVVEEEKTYKLGNLSPQTLFFQNDARRLHLITCAGTLTRDKKTYTHRHVVFAKFVDVVAV